MPIYAIPGKLDMVLPALRTARSCQSLIEDSRTAVAVDSDARNSWCSGTMSKSEDQFLP